MTRAVLAAKGSLTAALVALLHEEGREIPEPVIETGDAGPAGPDVLDLDADGRLPLLEPEVSPYGLYGSARAARRGRRPKTRKAFRV